MDYRMLFLKRYVLPSRIDSHDACEVPLNRFHIRFNIFSWMKHPSNANRLMLPIYNRQDNWNPCAFGNVIKAVLPFRHVMTCPFGRDGQDEMF